MQIGIARSLHARSSGEFKHVDKMAEWKDLCLHEDVEELILARLRSCALSARMLAGVQSELVSRREVGPGAGRVDKVATEFVKKTGFEVHLKNLVYHELVQLYHRQSPLPLLPPSLLSAEPLAYMRLAQEDWEGRMRRGVNTLCTELGTPLAKERSESEQYWIRRRWSGLGADFPVSSDVHSIYAPNDLLDVLMHVRSPNTAVRNGDSSGGVEYGLMKVKLSHKSLYDLREVFSVLGVATVQVETALRDNGEAAYIEKANKVIGRGLHPLAREVCKRGCPVTSRRQLWSLALGLDTSLEKHAFHFEKLKSSVIRTHLFLEKLLVKEVKETTANDDNYFVFEDSILQVVFAFLHDYSILDELQYTNITPMKAHIRGSTDESCFEAVYPPNGIIPFQGFSFFVAPLCYVLAREDHVYAMFKQLYLRYFIHLHCISSHPQGIVGLCCLFESLLHARQPDLVLHLTAIQADPLRLVFGWMVTAFASHLDCREVLQLWDRVIGFDSVDIIAVFAVAVLEFRAVNLFKATCLSEAEAILSDLRCLNVLPLLQQTLFL